MVNGSLSRTRRSGFAGLVNVLLTKLSDIAAMPSLTLCDKLIWFAHCPKAGGTSVEQFMVAHWGDAIGHLHWGWDRWWRRGGWRVANPPNSPQHLTWADACSCLPRPPDAVFAVVRDPVARMASEHRWQRHGRRGTRIGKALAWLPFPLWLRLMLAVADRNPHAFDNHFRPQAEFVPDTAHVFRLENGLGQVATWLVETLGTPDSPDAVLGAGFPHAIPTHKKTAAVAPAERALIGAVFAVDYARFGYALSKADHTTRPVLNRLADTLAPVVVWADRRGAL